MEKAITRKESYLQAIASGDKSDLPSPITREEMLLYEIALRGGGGAVDPSVITEAVNDYLDKHPVSGADVPTTDIDFSNWEGGIN